MRQFLVLSLLVIASTGANAQSPAPPTEAPDAVGVVDFAQGSTRVDSSESKRIASIARGQAKNPSSVLILEAHASKEGSRSKNLRLSQERGDAVRRVLIQAGADPNRLVTVAYGDRAATGTASADRRVIIRSTVGFPERAGERTETPTDQTAPRAQTAAPRAQTAAPRTATPAPPPANNSPTIVIVTPNAPAPSSPTPTTPPPAATPPAPEAFPEGFPGRTSGGSGESAETGLGMDPTAKDSAPQPGARGPYVLGGVLPEPPPPQGSAQTP